MDWAAEGRKSLLFREWRPFGSIVSSLVILEMLGGHDVAGAVGGTAPVTYRGAEQIAFDVSRTVGGTALPASLCDESMDIVVCVQGDWRDEHRRLVSGTGRVVATRYLTSRVRNAQERRRRLSWFPSSDY